jgi:hypothetical protein
MATRATTRGKQETACTPTLCVAFALGVPTWQLGCTTGAAQRPRARHVAAGACHTVLEERRRAKRRCGFPAEARGVRGAAAGRDGVGLQRFLRSQGGEPAVVDAASRAGKRRARRAKTERLEVHQWLTRLRRHTAGAKQVWSVVRVPSGVDAARRPRHQELLPTQRERTRVSHRITGRRAGDGMRMAWPGEVETPRDAVRPGAGTPRPSAWCARLQREWQQVQPRPEPSGSLEAARRAAWRTRAERGLEPVRPWATLRGMGVTRAGRCVRALFAWRDGQTPTQGGA